MVEGEMPDCSVRIWTENGVLSLTCLPWEVAAMYFEGARKCGMEVHLHTSNSSLAKQVEILPESVKIKESV